MAEQTTGARNEALRFDATTGSPPGAGGAMQCSRCAAPIGAYYYEAAGAVYCARCKRTAEEEQSKSATGGMLRPVLLGLGAALLGAAGYVFVTAVTGYNIGFVALGVAWLVSQGVQKGNGRAGGRGFQILALALTFVAVAIANVVLGSLPPSPINLLIIAFTLRYAWTLNAGGDGTRSGGLVFTGPYKVGAPHAAGA